MKLSIKIGSAIAAAALSLSIAVPAFADDAPPPADPSVSATNVAPPVSETPAPDVTAPAPAADTTPVVPIEQAVPALTDTPAVTTELPFATQEATEDWYAPLPATVASPFAVSQHLTVLACDGIVQHDNYTITSQAMLDDYNALLATKTLTGPSQDAEFSPHGYSVTALPTCPPTAPAAIACTVTGQPYTEDGYPDFIIGQGQRYGNPDASIAAPGHALNWLVPVSGNLQGFTTASYTISSATGYQAAFRFVLFSNGTTGYTSVSAEPYMNGWVAGQTGTFTITQDTLVWNSHIANGNPGSQSNPVALSAMALLIPNNALISEGIHSGSNFVAGQSTTVSAITGCVTYAATPLPTVTFPDGSQTDPTCTVTDNVATITGSSYTLPVLNENEKYSLNADGSRPVAGTFDLAAGTTVSFTAHTLASAQVVQASHVYTFTGAAMPVAQSTNADAACYVAPPVVVVPPTTPTTPVAKVLGYTGGVINFAFMWTLIGGLFVLGVLFLVIKAIRTKRSI